MKTGYSMNCVKRILAIVVTYYPEADLLKRNISSFKDDVDEIFIWENTPDKFKEEYRFVKDPKIEYVGDGVNSYSRALNFALRYAIRNDFDYLLIMDQDSVWINFHDFVQVTVFNMNAPFGIWGPVMKEDKQSVMFEKRRYLINSGMLISVEIAEKIGGWNEVLKVDGTDIQLGFEANRKGYNCYQVSDGILNHRMGYVVKREMLGKKISGCNYSPNRLYEIYRSGMIIMRMYPEQKEYKGNFYHIWIRDRMKSMLLIEDDKIKKTCAIIRGIFSGLVCKIK